jgi:Sec-independent protein translocase protein TatA
MAILGVLKTVFNLLSAIPTLLKFIREVQKELTLIKRTRDEEKRKEEAAKVAEDLKAAQAAEDERAQRDALSRIVNDYNR